MATGGIDQIITTSLINWVLRGRNPVAVMDPGTGRYTLSFGPRYKCMVAILLAVTSALAALCICVAPQLAPPGLVLVIVIFGSMWLAGLWAAVDAFLVRLTF